MKLDRGRRARRRALSVALALAVAGASLASIVPMPAPGARAQEASGTIVHSADGVFLRAEPAFAAEVLTTIPEGTTVGLRTGAVDTVHDSDGVTQWWPVSLGDSEGWVAGFYLEIGGFTEDASEPVADTRDSTGLSLGADSAGPSAAGPELATWDLANASAIVAEPDGVNLREEPASAGSKLRTLPYDTVVALRVDQLDTVYADGTRWWPVQVDDVAGWISGTYLAPFESASPADVAAEAAALDPGIAEAPSKIASGLAPGSYAMAQTDDGTGLNIRADGAPDAERIGIVPESDVVQVMDGPYEDPLGNPWYLITDGGVTGFVSGWYLTNADQPGGDPATSEIPSKIAVPGMATGKLTYPLASYVVTQGFGCSPYWFEPWNAAVGCNYHNGVDLAANMSTPLYAADGGVVEYAGWCDCGLGYYVKLDHGNGFKTIYGHMSELWVATGEAVTKDETIGAVGSTGISTGPHVHFIVEYNGVDQDPLAFLG